MPHTIPYSDLPLVWSESYPEVYPIPGPDPAHSGSWAAAHEEKTLMLGKTEGKGEGAAEDEMVRQHH